MWLSILGGFTLPSCDHGMLGVHKVEKPLLRWTGQLPFLTWCTPSCSLVILWSFGSACCIISWFWTLKTSEACTVFAKLLEGVDAFFVGTSCLLLGCKELGCLHASTSTPSTLAGPTSHHLFVCFLYSKKCITPKSEYCAVFALLMEGVDAFLVGTSCLLMCCKKLVHLHAPMATPSTLSWPTSHYLFVCFLYFPRNASSLQSLSIVLCLVHLWRELMHS